MEKNNFHLIGIGGIGMSALARLLLAQKYPVSGSDPSDGEVIQKLASDGAQIYSSHEAQNIEGPKTTVVYSTAISKDNPEIQQAQKLGCNLWHRSDLLAHLMKSYQSIAVAGTHGKTSTSALLSHTLIVANLSPSFVIGGLLSPQNINGQVGEGRYFVAEADESDQSFLKYFPEYAIVTNVEADHLDNYKDFGEISSCFERFIAQVQKSLIWCCDCENLRKINPKGISYGYHKNADIKIIQARQEGFKCIFDLEFDGAIYPQIELSMIGEHNILNAAAVFGLCIKLGVDQKAIREAFNSFLGVKRRAEKIGESQKVQIYDDYAHHPTEVGCMLSSFRKAFPKRRIIALFQPHRYTRLVAFQKEFTTSFSEATEVWVTDVFSAGEKAIDAFSMHEYAKEIGIKSQLPTVYVPKEDLLTYFKENIRPFDVLITAGAGDITHFGKKAFKELKEKPAVLKVALICGSISCEHYVSLVSSRFFINEYPKHLFELTIFKILPTGDWVICDEDHKELKKLKTSEVTEKLSQVDIAVPILHGRYGEDGMIQGFLQTLGVAYAGESYALSSFNMNKVWMKSFVENLGIKVPKGLSFHCHEWQKDPQTILDKVQESLNFPLVVKPACMGSTIGVNFVKNSKDLTSVISQVLELDDLLVIEERIFGRELEVSCLDSEHSLIVTHPGEVKSDQRNYDYRAKYSKNPIKKIVDAQITPEVAKEAKSLAKKIYEEMQLKSFARIDFFLTIQNELIFAEVNTLPGMTPKSLFQRTLMHHGIEGEEIINQMVIDGMYRHQKDYKKSLCVQEFLESIKNVTH